MRIKRFKESLGNIEYDLDYDYVYNCFYSLVEDYDCKIYKKKFSNMNYIVIECPDIHVMGSNIIGFKGKSLLGYLRKVDHITDRNCISIDDYVEIVRNGGFSEREVNIYNEILIGFKKLRDEYPNYSYEFSVKGGSKQRDLFLEIFPEK